MRWRFVIGCVVATGCGAGTTDQIASDAPTTLPDGFVPAHDAPVAVVDGALARWEEPLLFVRTQDGVSTLYLAREDGSNATPLTHGVQPAWAPGRTAIAFAFQEGPDFYDYGIYVIEPGRAARRLTTGKEPSWSPDGTRIVYVVEAGLATIAPDGSEFSMVLSNADVLVLEPATLANPSFAPNGTRLVFEHNVEPNNDEIDGVWVSNSNGTYTRQVDYIWSWHPSWSATNARIAYSTYVGLNVHEVGIPGGTTIVPYPAQFQESSLHHPVWISGGTRIAFSAFSGISSSRRRIYSVPDTGGPWVQLIPDDSAGLDYQDNDLQFEP